MARFFINYPELINNDILGDKERESSTSIPKAETEQVKKNRVRDNW